MKKTLLTLVVALLITNLYGQQDLVIGSSYQLSLQRQNIHGDAWILHNAEFAQDVDLLKWKNTHSSYGSRGIRFTYGSSGGIFFYADYTSTTAGSVFTPTTRFFIGNNGNIGIGTTTPVNGKLEVQGGNIWLQNTGATLVIDANGSNTTGQSLYFRNTGSAGASILYSRNLTFQSNSGGSIGIGKTPDSRFKLDVEGTIRASEVKVCLTGGCDFVFKDDYKLMNLNDLEKFVKTNQHLPEIAPEKEMVANGVDMKEFQMKLLQKIEELTLYTIEQNKKIIELEKQNAKIKVLEEKIEKIETASK